MGALNDLLRVESCQTVDPFNKLIDPSVPVFVAPIEQDDGPMLALT